MPTVATIDDNRVVIYLNDHDPAHVHVVGAGNAAIFMLHCPDGPPEIAVNHGYSRTQVRRIASALGTMTAALCAAWSDIHDPN